MSKLVTLEEAQKVLAAHRDAEQQEKNAKLQAYVGRFFKYRNCYSLPAKPSDYWWLYCQPREVEELGSLKGLTFQRDKDGGIEVNSNGRITGLYATHLGGWAEISAAEFWKAASDIRQRSDLALRRVGSPEGGKEL